MSVTTYAGCACCGSGSGSGSGGGGSGGGGTFPSCSDVPTSLNWVSTSADVACLNGLSGTITRSGTGSPYSWSNGNNLSPPCGTDNGFVISCTSPAGAFTAVVDNNSGVVVTLISQTATSLTFEAVIDGSGPLPAGTAVFVVVIP